MNTASFLGYEEGRVNEKCRLGKDFECVLGYE